MQSVAIPIHLNSRIQPNSHRMARVRNLNSAVTSPKMTVFCQKGGKIWCDSVKNYPISDKNVRLTIKIQFNKNDVIFE